MNRHVGLSVSSLTFPPKSLAIDCESEALRPFIPPSLRDEAASDINALPRREGLSEESTTSDIVSSLCLLSFSAGRSDGISMLARRLGPNPRLSSSTLMFLRVVLGLFVEAEADAPDADTSGEEDDDDEFPSILVRFGGLTCS